MRLRAIGGGGLFHKSSRRSLAAHEAPSAGQAGCYTPLAPEEMVSQQVELELSLMMGHPVSAVHGRLLTYHPTCNHQDVNF